MTADEQAHHESDEAVNTSARLDADGDVMVDRPDDDDHDLLTFGEAGARLEEEVMKQRRILERLSDGGADQSTLDGAQRRLAALEHARERNRPPTLDDLKSSGFFGPRT